MRVIPSQDERDLAAMCRGVLAAELEPDSQWKALADAGVLALVSDGSLSDIGVFCVEAGRALFPSWSGFSVLCRVATSPGNLCWSETISKEATMKRRLWYLNSRKVRRTFKL